MTEEFLGDDKDLKVCPEVAKLNWYAALFLLYHHIATGLCLTSSQEDEHFSRLSRRSRRYEVDPDLRSKSQEAHNLFQHGIACYCSCELDDYWKDDGCDRHGRLECDP